MENQTKPEDIQLADLPPLSITYYTDPLCCWSWAFEPVWQKLLHELGGQASWRICMGGMISSWPEYHDEIRSVSRPAQMGPVWMEAKHLTGAVIDTRLWIEDPPASSYPACVAVKTALLQGDEAASIYLYNLRKAAMAERKNIARKDVLLTIAAETAKQTPSFNLGLFSAQLANDASKKAFSKDLEEIKNAGIKRFPSLLISSPEKEARLLITGYRPFESVLQSLIKFSASPKSSI